MLLTIAEWLGISEEEFKKRVKYGLCIKCGKPAKTEGHSRTFHRWVNKKEQSRLGLLDKVQEYLKKNTIKLPDGSPIFSARYFIGEIEKAKNRLDKIIEEFEFNLEEDTIENRMILVRVKDYRTYLFGEIGK